MRRYVESKNRIDVDEIIFAQIFKLLMSKLPG
jgi:hypothetical protein